MAVTITRTKLRTAIRVGETTDETMEVDRLLGYATEAISKHLGAAYADTPSSVCNEAAVRLVGFLYDVPNVGRGDSFANALRSSGAARMLLPYRVHRAGSTGEAVAAAQEAVGTADNPVTGIAVSGSTLTVTFADGSTDEQTLPAGGTGGTDQTARDAAAAAQTTANRALSTANASVRPMPATPAEAAGGTSTTIRGWTAALIRAAINAVVPPWARTGDAATLPADKIADRSLIARMFAVDSVDHNALKADSVRRAAVLADAIGENEIDDAVLARIPASALPTLAQRTRGYALRQATDGETWELVAAATGGAVGHWFEMARYLTNSLAADTAANMTLRADGMTRFADAAAVRAAIAEGSIPMVMLQRSDSDAQVPGVVAPNFASSAGADYAIQFVFPNGDRATVKFKTANVEVTPHFAISSTLRLDLAVFA